MGRESSIRDRSFTIFAFIVNSFDHLYREVGRLEKWLLSGKLDNVSPGAPEIHDEDLQIFLNKGQI
jgi:hypothetical protein